MYPVSVLPFTVCNHSDSHFQLRSSGPPLLSFHERKTSILSKQVPMSAFKKKRMKRQTGVLQNSLIPFKITLTEQISPGRLTLREVPHFVCLRGTRRAANG